MESSRNVLNIAPRPVRACEPAAPWIGGKRNLAKRICAILAANPHDAYCEPFIGMGGVFLRRQMRPPVEVINDLSGDVVTLFRVLQRFPEALFRELRWRPSSRAEFDRLKMVDESSLLDIERAARFIYLQTLAFGGRVSGQNFGGGPVGPKTFNVRRVEPRLRQLHERLADVVIENEDWLAFITRYDRPGTLFYLDPPYWGGEADYGSDMFMRGDFQRMADKLATIEGRFILSINDRPEIREMFSWADIEAVTTTYTLHSGSAQVADELIIARGVDLAAASPQPSLF